MDDSINKKILRIVNWINDYANSNNFSTLVIGISGGVDSALTSTLCSLTKKNVIAVSLPLLQKEEELLRARKHIEWLKNNFSNVTSIEVDLTQIYQQYINLFLFNQINLSLANTKSRLRMVTLYHIAANNNALVVGTGNKIEDFGVGFFTKYGDGGVDISPIADLLKSEVFELAKQLNIIEDILLAKPTDGLWEDGRTDEDQLQMTYDDLEWAMCFSGQEESLSDKQRIILNKYKMLNKNALHKINPIPVCKLN